MPPLMLRHDIFIDVAALLFHRYAYALLIY